MIPYKIAIGSDHAGYPIKDLLMPFLLGFGHSVKDYGTFSEQSMDYPDIARPLSQAVANGEHNFGILVCGSGNGMSITANKIPGVRSALCWIPEIATLARSHNDANVCAIPGRFVSIDRAQEIVRAFLETRFEGGRHAARVCKIEP